MNVTLHCGDCLEFLPTIEPGTVDAVITDPPYGVGYASWDGAVPPQDFLTECLRVATGPVVWFGAAVTERVFDFARYSPAPDRMLVWAPSFTLSKTSKSRIFYRFHPIWCWRSPKSQSVLSSDVLRHNSDGRHWWNHPATKPEGLMTDLILAFSSEGGTVLDPFAGSGTTGVACVKTGRNFVGIELNPDYLSIASRRINAAVDAVYAEPPLFAGTPA